LKDFCLGRVAIETGACATNPTNILKPITNYCIF
jgi:hypothetical protein